MKGYIQRFYCIRSGINRSDFAEKSELPQISSPKLKCEISGFHSPQDQKYKLQVRFYNGKILKHLIKAKLLERVMKKQGIAKLTEKFMKHRNSVLLNREKKEKLWEKKEMRERLREKRIFERGKREHEMKMKKINDKIEARSSCTLSERDKDKQSSVPSLLSERSQKALEKKQSLESILDKKLSEKLNLFEDRSNFSVYQKCSEQSNKKIFRKRGAENQNYQRRE